MGMIFSVWTPPDSELSPEAFAEHLSSGKVAERLGFSVNAMLIDQAAADAAEQDEANTVTRRLVLRLPQAPGIVLGVTELLKDYGCKMASVDADTTERDGEIWFELEASIEVPASEDPNAVGSALQFWTDSRDARAVLSFDSHPVGINPLSGA